MLDFTKREKFLLGLAAVLILICAGEFYYIFSDTGEDIAFKLEETPTMAVSSTAWSEEPNKIVIYITGAVKQPGVYELSEGDRVKDAIEAAGGTLPEADLVNVNLAQKVRDEDKIYIPEIGELDNLSESYDHTMPVISSSDSDKIDINSAGLAELDQLPGIGPATAQKIIDYREQNGPFKTIEELKNISGIGDKKFEDLKDKITAR